MLRKYKFSRCDLTSPKHLQWTRQRISVHIVDTSQHSTEEAAGRQTSNWDPEWERLLWETQSRSLLCYHSSGTSHYANQAVPNQQGLCPWPTHYTECALTQGEQCYLLALPTPKMATEVNQGSKAQLSSCSLDDTNRGLRGTWVTPCPPPFLCSGKLVLDCKW